MSNRVFVALAGVFNLFTLWLWSVSDFSEKGVKEGMVVALGIAAALDGSIVIAWMQMRRENAAARTAAAGSGREAVRWRVYEVAASRVYTSRKFVAATEHYDDADVVTYVCTRCARALSEDTTTRPIPLERMRDKMVADGFATCRRCGGPFDEVTE